MDPYSTQNKSTSGSSASRSSFRKLAWFVVIIGAVLFVVPLILMLLLFILTLPITLPLLFLRFALKFLPLLMIIAVVYLLLTR